MQEFKMKLEQIRQLLRDRGLDGMLLTQQKNVAWLTSGRCFINMATETAVAFILITREAVTLIVNNIEEKRLLEEELDGEFDRIAVFPWFEPDKREEIIAAFTAQAEIATDTACEQDLLPLRTALHDDELPAIRSLGRDAAEALEQTVFELQQGQTEYEIAGQLARQCISREIEPIVTLVAADRRVYTRRHPLPTGARLERYAMLVLCGRRKGRVISATRLVHFGAPPAELLRLYHAVAYIDAELIGHTLPDTTFTTLFSVMKDAYRQAGFEHEWQYHHQGGLSGYNTREALLLPDSKLKVRKNQIYAWNPSIAGVKSEDTILIGEQGPELLTYTDQFPYESYTCAGQTVLRPAILVRP
jgi:Xaa-Pro aminopeptidase